MEQQANELKTTKNEKIQLTNQMEICKQNFCEDLSNERQRHQEEVKNLEEQKELILKDLEMLDQENKELAQQMINFQEQIDANEEIKADNIKLSNECRLSVFS